MEFDIREEVPTVDSYNELRAIVGWGEISRDAAEIGLKNSLIALCAVVDGKVVGTARVIGDGGIYFYVQDMMVHPSYQGLGIGRKLMAELLKRLRERYQNRGKILLMAAKGKAPFYQKFGFSARDAESPGMTL